MDGSDGVVGVTGVGLVTFELVVTGCGVSVEGVVAILILGGRVFTSHRVEASVGGVPGAVLGHPPAQRVTS